MPSAPGPTISFARGAPSLDIVDVRGPARRRRARLRERPRRHDRLRHRDRLPAPAQLDRRAPRGGARARARHERLDAGGRVPVRAPRARRRRGDRRAPHVRPHAAVAARTWRARRTPSSSSPTGSTSTRWRACSRAARARRSPTSSPTSRTRPATRSRWRSAGACCELAGDHGFVVFEDDPYVELRFSGEPLPTMLSLDPEHVVYASSFSKTVCPGIRVGYLVGPAGPDRRDHASSPPTPTSRRTWSRSRSCTSSAPPARSSARSRPSGRRWPSAPQTLAQRAPRASSPRPSS